MPAFQSEVGYIGLAKQVASGTYVTPSKYMYVTSADINPTGDPLIPDPEIGGIRDIPDSIQVGPISWAGSLEFYVRGEALGLLLYSALGAVTSSGIAGQSGAYGHIFTPQDQCIPLSIEKRVGSKGSAMDVFGYQDVKVNSLHFECAAGELVTGTAEIIAIEERSGKTDQTATYETAPIFNFVDGVVNLEGVNISVKSISLDFNNNIADDDFRIGQRTLQTMTEKRRELSASMDIVPTDANIFKKTVYGGTSATAVSNTQSLYTGSLFVRFENPTVIGVTTQKYSMDITVGKAVFRAAPLPLSGDDMIIETLELLPVKASGANVLSIVLRNSIASY